MSGTAHFTISKAAENTPDLLALEKLINTAKQCQNCDLANSRKNVVFHKGNFPATIMLIGEGPGADEDQQGVPFVGQAGKLLDKIIKASELPWNDIYICNVVKCRPPGNRDPNKNEVKACEHFLWQQIDLLKPKIIVSMGSIASKFLLDPDAKITQIRGKWQYKYGCRIMPTYHPSALLWDANKKRPVWEDMQVVRDEYKGLKKAIEPELWPPTKNL